MMPDAIEDKAKELIAKIPIEDRTPQDIIDCRKEAQAPVHKLPLPSTERVE
jgi:hypothetical protein